MDYASSTPLDRGMLAAFPVISDEVLRANPSALHKEGVQARATLRVARELVAKTLFAYADEIIFTASATESDNLALRGVVNACIALDIPEGDIHIITTDTEHAAVLETVQHLGVATTILNTEQGVINEKDIVVPEGTKVVLLSVMYVNNEIGVVQPIQTIAKRVRFLRKHHPDTTVLFHVDATQAPLHFSLNTQKLGIDLMTLGATKLYCPKGAGLLYVRRDTPIAPIMYGGGQEFGLRPGTETLQLVHDFAHSLSFAQNHADQYSKSMVDLQSYFEYLIKKEIPQAVITAEHLERTPHISHIAFKDFDSELLVLELDARGIAVSAKSACKNEDANESSIVERIYGRGWGAVRFSFGRFTTKKDLETSVRAMKHVLEKY
jgi:cysteine desulfurase